MTRTIPNNELELSRIPGPDAPLSEIWRFALTFNAYDHWGSFEACADIANRRRHDTLTDLRTCLFSEQRRWRHFGDDPEVDALEYLEDIVTQIRIKVEKQELD